MFDSYLAEGGPLTEIQSQNIATAIELIEKNANHLTTNGLKALIDKALSETGGFPAVATVIKDGPRDEVKLLHEETRSFADDKYEPEIGIDPNPFDIGLEAIVERLNEVVRPGRWTIPVTVELQGTLPAGTQDSNSNQNTGTGPGGFLVPSGYPGDSFLMGLTSGERVYVDTAGQQSAGKNSQGYIDNRDQRVYMVNNGAGAAAVARAWLEMKRRSRINGWLGG
jgi:hypothetical protein